MKDKLFSIFITLLALITAYVFYALWHSEELSSEPTKQPTEEKQNLDLSNKKVVPKNDTSLADLKLNIEKREKKIIKDTPFQTQEEVEIATQEVYDALIPDTYEETIQVVNDAFDRLDEEVAAIDDKIAEEESSR